MNLTEELKAVDDKIDKLNEKLMQAKKTLRRNPNDTDAETEVEQYEILLAKLEKQRKEWFELVRSFICC
jgi:hypothetical protein